MKPIETFRRIRTFQKSVDNRLWFDAMCSDQNIQHLTVADQEIKPLIGVSLLECNSPWGKHRELEWLRFGGWRPRLVSLHHCRWLLQQKKSLSYEQYAYVCIYSQELVKDKEKPHREAGI